MSQKRSIKAVETMFEIVEQLRTHGRLGVTELAGQLDMQKSSVHHHLSTMLEHGYVAKDDGKYRLGAEFVSVGIDTRNSYPIYGTAKSEVRRLAKETGETAWCAIEEHGTGVFIYGYTAGSTINADSVMGTRFPLHCNSVGKAILSSLPKPRVESIIRTHGLDAPTENATTNTTELFDELERIRERRYALNLEEDIRGIHAVGVPILDDDAEPLGAISVGGAASRLTREFCENELAPLVLETADNIELNIVYE